MHAFISASYTQEKLLRIIKLLGILKRKLPLMHCEQKLLRAEKASQAEK